MVLTCHRLRYLSLATPPTGCLRFHYLAILARMTARPTEKDVAEAERLQKVMAGAD